MGRHKLPPEEIKTEARNIFVKRKVIDVIGKKECAKIGIDAITAHYESIIAKECKRLTDCAMEKSASLTDETQHQ